MATNKYECRLCGRSNLKSRFALVAHIRFCKKKKTSRIAVDYKGTEPWSTGVSDLAARLRDRAAACRQKADKLEEIALSLDGLGDLV